jgi:hypothetical protein
MSSYKLGKGAVATNTKLERFGLWTRVAMLTMVILAPIVAYILYSIQPPETVSGRTIDKGKFDPYVTFTTDYFTFTVPKTWKASDTGNVEGKMYVYKQSAGNESLGLLRIYINSDVISYQNYFTRMQPVTITGGNKLHPGEMQPNCTSAVPAGKNLGVPLIVSQAEVNFLCWVDGTNLYAVAGAVGGTSSIELTRTNGEKAKYIITYLNTAFTPNESSFTEVLKTFEAR